MSELKPGDVAPNFMGPTQDGTPLTQEAIAGKTVALYFYPKDDTPGCTTQACSFRDNYQRLIDEGVAVIGVSADGVASHQKFADKYSLPFPLVADEDKTIVQAYGVWKEKSMYGKTFMGVERSCFLIGADGKIKQIWRKVKPDENVALVLGAL